VGEARDNLRHREETSGSNIRSWVRGLSVDDETAGKVALWATERSVDAVVWTALEPKFSGEQRAPTQGEAVSYLSSPGGETQEMAEEYVRRAPEQIVTQLRIDTCCAVFLTDLPVLIAASSVQPRRAVFLSHLAVLS